MLWGLLPNQTIHNSVGPPLEELIGQAIYLGVPFQPTPNRTEIIWIILR